MSQFILPCDFNVDKNLLTLKVTSKIEKYCKIILNTSTTNEGCDDKQCKNKKNRCGCDTCEIKFSQINCKCHPTSISDKCLQKFIINNEDITNLPHIKVSTYNQFVLKYFSTRDIQDRISYVDNLINNYQIDINVNNILDNFVREISNIQNDVSNYLVIKTKIDIFVRRNHTYEVTLDLSKVKMDVFAYIIRLAHFSEPFELKKKDGTHLNPTSIKSYMSRPYELAKKNKLIQQKSVFEFFNIIQLELLKKENTLAKIVKELFSMNDNNKTSNSIKNLNLFINKNFNIKIIDQIDFDNIEIIDNSILSECNWDVEHEFKLDYDNDSVGSPSTTSISSIEYMDDIDDILAVPISTPHDTNYIDEILEKSRNNDYTDIDMYIDMDIDIDNYIPKNIIAVI